MASDLKIYEKFKLAFELNCFRLIISAYRTSITEQVIQLDWNENDISYVLYEKAEANIDRIQKYKIYLSPEFRIPKDINKIKGYADKLPRIDLKMSHFALKEEFRYFFEAKRLKENDSRLKSDYIKEGMKRFFTGKYPLGCMIGYLLEGNVDSTVKGINRLILKDKSDSEIINKVKVDFFENYYESKHSNSMIIKHLILDFTGCLN